MTQLEIKLCFTDHAIDKALVTLEEVVEAPQGAPNLGSRKFKIIGAQREVVVYRSNGHLIPGYIKNIDGHIDRLLPKNWIA